MSSAIQQTHLAILCALSIILSSCTTRRIPLDIPGQDAMSSPDFDVLWNYQDPAGTRAQFISLESGAEARWPLDLQLQLKTQIARTHSLLREFEEAHQVLDEVEQKITDETPIALIRYCLERGRTYNSNQQRDLASPLFLQAWNVSLEQEQDYYAADAAHMLGIAETGQTSLDWNHKAMEIAEASNDERARGWLGALYNNTGWTHHDNGEYRLALDLWVKAEAWHAQYGSKRTHRIAQWTIARCERSLENYEKALMQQRGLLAGEENLDETGYIHEEIAENLLALNRSEESREHFRAAHEVLSKDAWLQANDKDRLARIAQLGSGEGEQ